MSIPVEHDKRKKEILERALDVFSDEGYEDATFKKIADRCGITRTILYLYFKNKREIFLFSIKQFMDFLENEINTIQINSGKSIVERLKFIIISIFESLVNQKRLLSVIHDYLNHLRKSGGDPDERVRRRTIRLRHILSSLLIEGIKKGELMSFPVRDIINVIYGMMEAAIFRLVVLGKNDTDDYKLAATFFIDRIAVKTAGEI